MKNPIFERFKKALIERVNFMLEVAYEVAKENGCTLSKDDFLILVRDGLKGDEK